MGTLAHRGRIVWLSAVAITFAACTGTTSTSRLSPAAAPTSEAFLLFTSDQGVSVVDAASGRLIVDAPQAVAAPDLDSIATASASGDTTTITTLDAATGTPTASSDVRGALRLRAVSSFNDAVALTPAADVGSDPWAPTPRSVTQVTVAIPGAPEDVERFTLRGNFEPEAFSNDGESLYMLEYRPALHPTTYRVTRLYLEKGKVWPVFGPDKRVVENMTATRLQQTLSPRGNTLYTLYTNQPPAYLSGSVVEDPDERAFVHTLDLDDGFAVCIELPGSFGELTPDRAGIAATPTGRYVYAVDAEHGRVVAIDTRRFQVVRETSVDLSAVGSGPISAKVSADGDVLLIGGSDGLVALDTGTLDPVTAASIPEGVTGMAYADDGSLFVAWNGGIGRLDPVTLQTRDVLPSPTSGELEGVGTAVG
jgi:hypothetical protein